MRRSMLVFAMLFGFILTTAPLAVAQQEEVDVAEISETVLAADPEALVEGLESPPEDDQLPEGFVNPPSGTPANPEVTEELAADASDFEGALATVNFAFDTDPEVIDALISAGGLTYVIFEDEVDQEVLDTFARVGEEATPDPGTEVGVEDIELDGVDGRLITATLEQEGIFGVSTLIALPVGNVLVIGSLVVGDQQELDEVAVQTQVEELTLAGIEYLGTLAEG